VQGETGTGKEGAARAIHAWSKRKGPFVAVNCAALPVDLVEAELFGYRQGAFTGAKQASPGFFRAANRGTLFLDEILELPKAAQAKLLRALEQREVVSLGNPTPIATDVRVIAATQEPLSATVADKRFRDDLHARLDGLTVILPPLRARREDIVPLFTELLKQEAGGCGPDLDVKLVEALVIHDWPHNVRELVQLSRTMISIHGTERVLKKAHLPERVLAQPSKPRAVAVVPPASRPRHRSTDDAAQFAALVAALKENPSVQLAAEAMGITPSRAYRLLRKHPEFSPNSESG
jgi:transcriptional regulator with PAS, ATPase and Fis domain